MENNNNDDKDDDDKSVVCALESLGLKSKRLFGQMIFLKICLMSLHD